MDMLVKERPFATEVRVKCLLCDHQILPQTARRYGGQCRPCFKRQISQSAFGRACDAVFQKPKFKTKRFYSIWLNATLTLDLPLAVLRKVGHCDSLFKQTSGPWAAINTPADLKHWLIDNLTTYRVKAVQHKARYDKEFDDSVLLQQWFHDYACLIDLAYEMLVARHAHSA